MEIIWKKEGFKRELKRYYEAAMQIFQGELLLSVWDSMRQSMEPRVRRASRGHGYWYSQRHKWASQS